MRDPLPHLLPALSEPAPELGARVLGSRGDVLAEVTEPLPLPVPVLTRVRRLLVLAPVAVGVDAAGLGLVLAAALPGFLKLLDQVDDVVPRLEPPGLELVDLLDDPAVARDEDVFDVGDVRLGGGGELGVKLVVSLEHAPRSHGVS